MTDSNLLCVVPIVFQYLRKDSGEKKFDKVHIPASAG